MLQDGCNQDEFRSFTLKWRLYIRERGELDYSEVRRHLLSCIDETLVDAMHDALGYKINTSSVTDMMTELGKLAVNEPFTVEEIVTMVENMCMIPEEILIKQPDTHRNKPFGSLSKQTLPRFKDPALTQGTRYWCHQFVFSSFHFHTLTITSTTEETPKNSSSKMPCYKTNYASINAFVACLVFVLASPPELAEPPNLS
jgi:hypothetical protein